MNYPRIFLDTADMAKLREATSTGIVDGISTNPNKIAETGKSYREVVDEIRKFYPGTIAFQSMGKTAEEITAHALALHSRDSNLAIIEVIRQIRAIYDSYSIDSCIVGASIKNVRQVVESIMAGVYAVAVTWPIFEHMLNHPLTQKGYEDFEKAFSKIPPDKN